MAQVVEWLPRNCEALSSNPSTARLKKKGREKNWQFVDPYETGPYRNLTFQPCLLFLQKFISNSFDFKKKNLCCALCFCWSKSCCSWSPYMLLQVGDSGWPYDFSSLSLKELSISIFFCFLFGWECPLSALPCWNWNWMYLTAFFTAWSKGLTLCSSFPYCPSLR
jgi:hypothetical protein